jgi:hypothetical protein
MKENNPPVIGGETTIELIAGRHPNGELVVEKILVNPQPEENSFQLLKSPLFVRGVARTDVIQLKKGTQGQFNIVKHGGNLCVRVFSKQDFNSPQMEAIEQALTSELEKLGGDLDIKEARALVYSIHVSCGFNVIEGILNNILSSLPDMAWLYGNVYDPDSGEPLDWWQPILAPE